MWYYVKEKQKIGPVSDAAIHDLFRNGVIKKSTLVWAPEIPTWIPMEDSSIYKRITKPPKSNSLAILNTITYALRAFIVAWIIFLGVRGYYLVESYNFFRDIWTQSQSIESVQDAIRLVVLQQTITMTKLISWLLIFIMAGIVARWFYIIAHTSKSIDNSFKYSPYAAAFSFIIPFVNFILPCQVMWSALKASLYATRQKLSAFDVSLFFSWWTCWIITALMFMVQTFTSDSGSDNIQVSICFAIFVVALMALTSFLFLLVVSRITSLQRKFFSNAENLKSKTAHIDARTF